MLLSLVGKKKRRRIWCVLAWWFRLYYFLLLMVVLLLLWDNLMFYIFLLIYFFSLSLVSIGLLSLVLFCQIKWTTKHAQQQMSNFTNGILLILPQLNSNFHAYINVVFISLLCLVLNHYVWVLSPISIHRFFFSFLQLFFFLLLFF